MLPSGLDLARFRIHQLCRHSKQKLQCRRLVCFHPGQCEGWALRRQASSETRTSFRPDAAHQSCRAAALHHAARQPVARHPVARPVAVWPARSWERWLIRSIWQNTKYRTSKTICAANCHRSVRRVALRAATPVGARVRLRVTRVATVASSTSM